MENSPDSDRSTPTTSMRISSNRIPCAMSQRTASRRSRLRFFRLMASIGVPYLTPERVFTSQTTRALRSAATMSISPSAHRQFRSSIRRPARCRYSTASCSPCLPRTSLAFTPHHLRIRRCRIRRRQADADELLWKTQLGGPHPWMTTPDCQSHRLGCPLPAACSGRVQASAHSGCGQGLPQRTSGEALLLMVGELQVALGQFFDVDVLEGDYPHIL